MPKSRFFVVTTCTNAKRDTLGPIARFRNVPKHDLSEALSAWFALLEKQTTQARADQVYKGRSFAEAQRTAAQLNAPLLIVSAGLGLIRANANIPLYDATIAPGGANSIQSRLKITPSKWWDALKRAKRVGWPSDGTLLVAASSKYLEMIADDLVKMPPDALRIFTRASINALPEPLRLSVMPYDARLDARKGRPGTINDFPQRALAHFAEHILTQLPQGSLHAHKTLVLKHLSPLKAPTVRVGMKVSDDEIKKLIRKHYNSVGGRSGLMLRTLRDDLGIACEQSRFRTLFNAINESTGRLL
jgi:hypothetical protein